MLKSGKDRNAAVFEYCFCCGKTLTEGIGRFRKDENVFCIKCYKDNALSCNESEHGEFPDNIHVSIIDSSGIHTVNCN